MFNTHKILFILLELSISLILFLGCSSDSSSSEKKVDSEGVIEYEVKVIDDTHPLAGYIPSTASFKFKKDKFLMDMSPVIAKMKFIIEPTKKTMTQTISFMDVKYYAVEDEKEIKQQLDESTLILKPTNDTLTIAGYLCKKVIASKIGQATTFDIYYTDEINVENPNLLTPYSSIKGMLMDYRIKKMGIEISLKAKSVKDEIIPDSLFVIPKGFEGKTKKEMDDWFHQFY